MRRKVYICGGRLQVCMRDMYGSGEENAYISIQRAPGAGQHPAGAGQDSRKLLIIGGT